MSRLVQVKEYMSRAEEIKNMLQNGQAAAQPPSNGQGVGQQAKPKDGGGGGGGGGGGENVSRPVTCLASVACLAALLMLDSVTVHKGPFCDGNKSAHCCPGSHEEKDRFAESLHASPKLRMDFVPFLTGIWQLAAEQSKLFSAST